VTISLGDIANEVTLAVDRLSHRDDLRATLRSLVGIEEASDALLERLLALGECVSAGRQAGFAPESPDIADGVSRLTTLAAQLEAGEIDREFAQKALDAVSALIREADESLMEAWRDYIAEQVPSPKGLVVLAETFQGVQGATAAARELLTATRSVQALLNQRPSPVAVRTLAQLSSIIPSLLQDIVGEEPQVRQFADELARGGASIKTLTPAVVSWMREKGFGGSFKVVPGRPAEQ